MTPGGEQRGQRLARLALTGVLLAVVLFRGAALLTSKPLLALANNYDMVRVQACIDAYPVRGPGIPPTWGSGDAPIERYAFRTDVGAPCYATSEALFAFLARPLFRVEAARSGDGTFSIRWLGLVKFAAFFTVAAGFSIAWWLRGQQAAATANAALAAAVLTDPAITLYLSGFYAEYSVVLFGYASIAGAAFLLSGRRPPGIVGALLLALTVAAFVGTKIQHIGLGILLAVAFALAAWRARFDARRVVAALALGGLAGLLFQAVNLARTENDVMRLANKTSTVLTSLLPLSDDPYRTAEALGLPRRCGDDAGVNWYLPPIRENAANHPCPEVRGVSYLRLLGLAATDPALFVRFVVGGFDVIRPWIPSTYRGTPHLGVVAGQMQAPLPAGWFSLSRILDRLPLWLIGLLVVGPVAIMLTALTVRRAGPLPLAAVLMALALLPLPVMLAVVFGNGYEDAAKQMHLAFALSLSFWGLMLLAALRAIAGWLRAKGEASPGF
jgi:hypothetical protein